jgi:hypothetical protein
MRRAAAALLVVVALWGCGDGLAEPSGFDAGPPPLPTGTNFLDERLAGCPTLAELASVADHKMIFDDTTAVGPLLCHATEGSADLTYARKRVMWALILMKELRFDAPLPWTSKPLYDWYRDTINGVRIIGGEGTSRLGLDRMAIIFVRTSSTEALKWPSLQQFIGLLLHEVRHVDVGAHPCQGQWDNRVSDMGATGVQNLFFTWIGEHAEPAVIPVEYRPYANHTACTHRGSAFCMEPRQDCR